MKDPAKKTSQITRVIVFAGLMIVAAVEAFADEPTIKLVNMIVKK